MKPGISNRRSAPQEARERRAHPPIDPGPPPPEDASGHPGAVTDDALPGGQTSHKAGSRSAARKQAGARAFDRATPSASKVAGAFGREPRRR
jgi:hypothetical protein